MRPTRPEATQEAIAHAILPRDEWSARGVSGRRLASGEFRRVFAGFHTPTHAPASLTDICRVLQQHVLPGSVISHSTAAVHLGIPLPHELEDGVGLLAAGRRWGPQGIEIPARLDPSSSRDRFAGAEGMSAAFPPLHCVAPRSAARIRGHGIIVHRLRPAPTFTNSGIDLSHPAEVLLQLATMLPLWDLVAAIDGAVGPKSLLSNLELAGVSAYARQQAGRRGRARLHRAIGLSRSGVESPGETYVRLLLRGVGFAEPTPNVPVHVALEGRTRRVDNGWEGPRIGMEYDGDWRRLSRTAWREDQDRRDALAAEGWELRRQTRADLIEPLPFLLRTRSTLARRGIRVPDSDRIRRFVSRLWIDRPALMYGPRTCPRR